MRLKVSAAGAGALLGLASLWVAGLGLSAGALRAQIHPDPGTGRELADKLCTGCHIVGNEVASAAVPADVPSFKAIADKPGQTTEAIAGRIVVPHPPMPEIQLTREEIGDLATYILSLRSAP
jgi:mono/diheme cytochrome c family protein